MSDVRQISFYVMAAPALKGLLDEFRLLVGDDEAADAMYRYGRRCGRSLVEALEVQSSSRAEVINNLPLLLGESGLGMVTAVEDGEEIVVSLSEAIEKSAMKTSDLSGCHFTAGYLAGIVESAIRKRCSVIEEDGPSDSCVFRVKQNTGEDTFSPISIDVEEETSSICPYERGTVYTIHERKPSKCYEALAKWLGEGRKGLCVTRDFPDKLGDKYGLKGARIIWLSNADGEGIIEPTKLSSIFFEMQMFMQENPSSMVVLSGLEFLVTHNGFLSTLKLVHLLSEQASVSGCILLLPINPQALDPKDISNLERESTPFPLDD